MIKRLFFLGVVLIFLSLEARAQFDFREGLIITAAKDTIYGSIDYRGSRSNAERCVFKTKISKISFFAPDQLQSFQFTNGGYYVSKTVNFQGNTHTLFLEYLFDGIVDMYYMNFKGKDYYYAGTDDNTLYLLQREEKEVIKDNKKYLLETKAYQNILMVLFAKSPLIQERVGTVPFKREALIKIAKDYHNQVSSDDYHIYSKKLSKVVKEFGPFLGVNLFSFSARSNLDDAFYYLMEGTLGKAFSPSVGFFYKTNLPSISEKLNIQYSGGLSYASFEGTNTRQEPLYNFTEINDISLKRLLFKNTLTIKYEFPQGKVRPTFQFGGFTNYSLSSDYERNYELKDTDGDTLETRTSTESPFSNFYFGFTGGIGFKIKTFNDREVFFDLDYSVSESLRKFEGLKSNLISFNLGIPIGKR